MDGLIKYRPLVVALITVMLIVGCRGDDSDLVSSKTGEPATPAPQSALPGLPSLPSLDKSTVITVAGVGPIGDGAPATSARLAFPMGLALDSAGNLFISDSIHQRVRRVDAESGVITTVAGFGEDGFSGDGGPAVNAKLSSPRAVAVDRAGNLFISDLYNHRVRRVDAATGVITTVAGTSKVGFFFSGRGGDGDPAIEAQLDSPRGLVVDSAGNLFIAGGNDARVRRVDAVTGIITTVAGNGERGFGGDGGPASKALLSVPHGLTMDAAGNLFITDLGNQRVRRVDADTGIITTVAGNGERGFGGDGGPATSALLHTPSGVAVDAAGNLFIAELNNRRVRRVDAVTGVITTVAGTGEEGFRGDGGPATDAVLHSPVAVAIDSRGNLLIADQLKVRVRRVDALTGIITTVAGSGGLGFIGDGGPATKALLDLPSGVALDREGNLFIADWGYSRVRRVDALTG
jgi:sugar lactone lactonase YvrE